MKSQAIHLLFSFRNVVIAKNKHIYKSNRKVYETVVLMDKCLGPDTVWHLYYRLPSTIELPLCIMPRRCKYMRGSWKLFRISLLLSLLGSLVQEVPFYLVRRASFETFRCILLNKLHDVTCYRTHYIVRGSVEVASVILQHRNIMSAQVRLL